jgi:hypothetical protein
VTRPVLVAAFTGMVCLASAVPAPAQLPIGPAIPSTPLGRRGFVTDRATAERTIAFRPVAPGDPISEVALLPPFHGAQVSVNEGIGYAYAHAGETWTLLEWPRRGGTLDAFPRLPAEAGCTFVYAIGGKAKPRGLVWTTPHGLVFALTAEEAVDPPAIHTEFRRLVRRGACS